MSILLLGIQFYLNHSNRMQLNEWAIIVCYRIYTAKAANFRNNIPQMKRKEKGQQNVLHVFEFAGGVAMN